MYTQQNILSKQTGNNAFSYHERIAAFGKAEITIPTYKKISSVDQVQLGNHIVFEEVGFDGKLGSYTGLAHIYELVHNSFPNTYIFDNHNHALRWWLQHIGSLSNAHNITTILHIDQHSDLNECADALDKTKLGEQEYIRYYCNIVCNVGNFVQPFLQLYPHIEFIWIKSESQLLEMDIKQYTPGSYILDIDLDFRAPEMSNKYYNESIEKVNKLLINTSLATIATSPYFLGQNDALSLLRDIGG